jgi:hypothetical protein
MDRVVLALKAVCDHLKIKSSMVALSEISHPQNRAIVKALDIPLVIEKDLPSPHGFDAYAVLDFQSAYTRGLSDKLPCAVHIDHHAETDDDVNADFRLVSDRAGAASTYMALIPRARPPPSRPRPRPFNGAHARHPDDTDNLPPRDKLDSRRSSTQRKGGRRIIQKVYSVPLSEDALRMFGAAMAITSLPGLVSGGPFFIRRNRRDSIALVGDFLLVERARKP